jgi:beta-lactamase superfamily II metal-dependent hydrolase
MHQAEDERYGPLAHLLDGLNRSYVSVRTCAAGQSMMLGDTSLAWLHPPARGTYDNRNDSSMVILATCAQRSVLLTGDIQEEAIGELTRHQPDLRADVMELPHHGSFHGDVARLVERVDPLIIMQSTAYTRWAKRKWGARLDRVERLVTARDGACWVEIDENGGICVGRFRGEGGPVPVSDFGERIETKRRRDEETK